VNATPLGADGQTAPPMPTLAPGVVVVDLLYRPAVTPLQAAARAAGAEAHGGLGLLLHQAALSFELWTGTPAPLEVMSAAAVAALTERR
jgi:shikimate dehydrogenase